MGNEGIRIQEKRPDGENSVRYVVDRILDNVKKSSDLRDVWKKLEPDIKQALAYEFSDANPNSWASLDDKYVKWKRKKGFPDTIGIMSGALKKSLVNVPEIKRKKMSMELRSKGSVKGYKGKPVSEYAQFFNLERPIFQHTIKFIDSIYKRIVTKAVLKGKKWPD